MTSGLALFLFSLFSLITFAFGAPVSNVPGAVVELEQRTSHTGRGTWFNVGLGNCGKWNKDSDHIVAISKQRYDANGGNNCNQWMAIVNTKNGKTAYALTRDSCESCGTEDIDMSPSLFQQLDALSVGQLKVSWHFMPKGWAP